MQGTEQIVVPFRCRNRDCGQGRPDGDLGFFLVQLFFAGSCCVWILTVFSPIWILPTWILPIWKSQRDFSNLWPHVIHLLFRLVNLFLEWGPFVFWVTRYRTRSVQRFLCQARAGRRVAVGIRKTWFLSHLKSDRHSEKRIWRELIRRRIVQSRLAGK